MRQDPVCGSQTRCDALDLWLVGCLCRLFDLAFFGVCGDCCCCSTQRAHTPDPQAQEPLSLWTEVWPTQPVLIQGLV